MRIGRTEVSDVKVDGRNARPFYFTVTTRDRDGEIILSETRREYQHETARRERVAVITQLQSAARKRRRKRGSR